MSWKPFKISYIDLIRPAPVLNYVQLPSAFHMFGVSQHMLCLVVWELSSLISWHFSTVALVLWYDGAQSQPSNDSTDACARSFRVSEVLFWDGCVMMATVGGICDIGLWNSLAHISLSLSISHSCVSHTSNTNHTVIRDLWLWVPKLLAHAVSGYVSSVYCAYPFGALCAWHVISSHFK